jgi:hypothetical protein
VKVEIHAGSRRRLIVATLSVPIGPCGIIALADEGTYRRGNRHKGAHLLAPVRPSGVTPS